ncbi:DUF4922 domain-containing protein [bacterium]|nr:DUF4922 domain-containing protein [bacterium]RQV92055.1 MAG: DUF4922 domain-containing protein [bacterium]
MSKYYQELESEAEHTFPIDSTIQKLIQYQQDAGFGFPQYWDTTYRFQDFYRDYEDGLIHRILNSREEKLKRLIRQEQLESGNPLVEDRPLFTDAFQFAARKILWRAFRRIGFQGTKSKGEEGAVHDGCWICMENIPDEQKGFRITGPDGSLSHVILMNPFPILKDQVTIASLQHEPQELTEKHIRFILDLVERSEAFKYSFNGIGAGASIPAHFHFYGFAGTLPVEEISLSVPIKETDHISVHRLDPVWPISAIVLTGHNEPIVAFLLVVSKHLHSKNLRMNILFTRDDARQARVYVFPRKKAGPEPGTGFHRLFGSIEMGGMLVCESSVEYQNARGDHFVEALKQVGVSGAGSSSSELVEGLTVDL